MRTEAKSSERTSAPAAEKSFRAALRRFIREEFPRLGGEKVVALFIDELLGLVESHHLTRDRVGAGQLLWYAVDAQDPPFRHKRMADTRLVPVLLSLITPEDVEERRRGAEGPRERAKRVAARLLEEARAQGGVLSLADLALLMGLSPGYLSDLIGEWEREHGAVLPRRGTVHDLGPSLTHKAAICRKAVLEGKQTPEIARETHHSPASVDRYLLDLERVAYAMLKHGMSLGEICFTTQMSEGLVRQYAQLVTELGLSESSPYQKEVGAKLPIDSRSATTNAQRTQHTR
ncbi:MAG: DUF1670 domain-containing protein [Actinobacteria bacterium]|nr:DUF1670 domain-containing protein [Actinomycetota bacterium]